MEYRHNPSPAEPATSREEGSRAPIVSPSLQAPSLNIATSSTASATLDSLDHGIAQSRVQTTPVKTRSRVIIRLASYLSRFVKKAKAIIGRGSWFGVGFKQEGSDEARTWIITITKPGRWLLYFHLLIHVVSIFELVTIIYSWKANADNDAMLQKVLMAVTKSGSRLEGFDSQFTKWINSTKLYATEEDARLAEEQNRWNALLKVFEDCGASQSWPNGTDGCDSLRRHFETNRLPHPDKSPIANRNIAKLDRVIRRVHLGGHHGTNPSPSFRSGISSGKDSIGLIILTVFIIMFCLLSFAFAVGLKRWGLRNLRRYRKRSRHELEKADEGLLGTTVEDASVPIIATGGDYLASQNNLIHRNHVRFDQHATAARGSVEGLRDNEVYLRVNDIDKNNEFGTVLAAASRSGNLDAVEYVLRRSADVHLQGGRYHNALQAAAHSGDDAVVHRLLIAGARDISVGGFYGTAVNAAAEKGSVGMLQDLLSNCKDKETVVNHPGGTYGHALMAAAARGHQGLVTILLDSGALVSQPNAAGTTALHQAALNGHMGVVETLLAWDAEVNSISSVYATPLHAACRALHADVANSLLATKVDVSIKDPHRCLPLHEAAGASEGFEEVIQKIHRLRPDLINEVDASGRTALHHASIAGNAGVVEILLDANADCSIGDASKAQPLSHAACRGHADVVKLLLERGKADPDAPGDFGNVALHEWARTDDGLRVYGHLIKANANVNAVREDGTTPLHVACQGGRIKNVRLLLSHPDIKVNELDDNKYPPLYMALCSPSFPRDECVIRSIIAEYLDHTDVDVDVSHGFIVQEAARRGFQAEVETMLSKSKASIQMHRGAHGGVLQAASISGHLPLVNLLLEPEYHAEINLQGGEFGCPLAAAAAFGHVDVVRRLLEAGADPSAFGDGRYGSPMRSTCREVKEDDKAKEPRRWAAVEDQIRGLLREYRAAPDTKPRGEEGRYTHRYWAQGPTGWEWASL